MQVKATNNKLSGEGSTPTHNTDTGNLMARHLNEGRGKLDWRKLGRPALHTKEPLVQMTVKEKEQAKTSGVNRELGLPVKELCQGLSTQQNFSLLTSGNP